MDIAEKILRSKQDLDNVYKRGTIDNAKRFNDLYQNFGKRGKYAYAYSGVEWVDEIYNPEYDIVTHNAKYGAYCAFLDARITNVKVKVYVNTNTGDTDKSIFANCINLVTIPLLDITYYNGSYDEWFKGCTSLKNLKIAGKIKETNFNVQWSTELTHDSIISILNALHDYSSYAGSIERQVTIGSTNKAKLTSDELKIATNKGWQVN